MHLFNHERIATPEEVVTLAHLASSMETIAVVSLVAMLVSFGIDDLNKLRK